MEPLTLEPTAVSPPPRHAYTAGPTRLGGLRPHFRRTLPDLNAVPAPRQARGA